MKYDAINGNRRPTPPGRSTAGFAQPAGYGGAEQCSAKPRLRPFAGEVTELLASLGNGCGGAVIKEVLPC